MTQIIIEISLLILVGFFVGFATCLCACKRQVKKIEEVGFESARTTTSIITNLNQKLTIQRETVECITNVCLDQKEQIDDLTEQISSMKIIRLGTKTSKILEDNLEKEKNFLNGIGKN